MNLTIYGHGGHLGHVVSIMLINLHFNVSESLSTKGGRALSPFLAPFRSQNMKDTAQQFLLDVLLAE